MDTLKADVVLVTGAKGRVARRVLPLLAPHFPLVLSDRGPGEGLASYRQADITDFEACRAVMEGVDTVLHLAIASPESGSGGLSVTDEAMLDVNIRGALHLYEAARLAGVRRVVFVSSLTAHLGNKERIWYDEQTPLEPLNLYACTKIFGENLARLYYREYGLSSLCLRLGQPYPLSSELDDIWRANKRIRSFFVTIEDIARAIVCALETKMDFGIYNIVSASDNPRVDLAPSGALGYVPRGYFCDEGLLWIEGGAFPTPPGPIVTHWNPPAVRPEAGDGSGMAHPVCE